MANLNQITDPVFIASAASGIVVGDITNWNTAFGWGNHAGLYPLLSGSYANPSWISSLAYAKITGVPSSLPTSSTLDQVLTNGNDAINSDVDFVGDNRGIGWWNGANRRWLLRQEAAPGNNIGWYAYNDGGTPTNLLVINRSTGVFAFTNVPTRAGNTMWDAGNHPSGSAFTPTLTGANVLASMTMNSAGHVSALTTRAMTAGDISAAPASGSGSYIQNQNASAQSSSNFFISGSGEMNGSLSTNLGNSGAHIRMQSAGRLLRFGFGLTGTESGSNAGSDFNIWRYTDAGAFISSAFSITRSSGAVAIPGTVTISGKTLMPTQSGVRGTGTGNGNIGWFGFYESDGTTRQGFVGVGSGVNQEIQLISDNDNLLLQSTTSNINLNAIGVVNLSNGTKNHLIFNGVGLGAPTFTTRSLGAKVVLYPNLSGSAVDWGLGMETGFMWSSVANSSVGFKWYGGTTEVARLTGTGQFSVNTSVTTPIVTSPTSSDLDVRSGSGGNITISPEGTLMGTWEAGVGLAIGSTPSSINGALLDVNGNIRCTDAFILATTASPSAEFGLSGSGVNSSAFVRTMGTGNLDLQTNASNTIIRLSGTTQNVLINGATDNTLSRVQVAGDVQAFGLALNGNRTITTSGALTASDSFIEVDNSLGNVSIELPAVGTVASGKIYIIKKVSAGSNIFGLNSSSNIDGNASFGGTTYPQYTCFVVMAVGGQWRVISKYDGDPNP